MTIHSVNRFCRPLLCCFVCYLGIHSTAFARICTFSGAAHSSTSNLYGLAGCGFSAAPSIRTVFPAGANGSLGIDHDADADGVADILDVDNDGDMMPDRWEVEFGFDPNDADDAAMDADGDGLSNLDEFTGGSDPRTADETPVQFTLDVDGNNVADALTDGILMMRYMFGFRGPDLVENAVGDGCSRCNHDQIQQFLGKFDQPGSP